MEMEVPDPADFLALIDSFGAAPDEEPAVDRFLSRAGDPSAHDEAVLALARDLLGKGAPAATGDDPLTRARAAIALFTVSRLDDETAPSPEVAAASLHAARVLWRTGGLSPDSEEAFRALNAALTADEPDVDHSGG